MEKTNKKREQIKGLVLGAVLTAIVIVLQLMGSFIRFGPFSISLVLIPIVIGAAMCGIKIGAWLGFVFGAIVLISGDAAAFMAIDIFGTIVTVLLKGTACGLAAGLVYKALEKYNRYVAVIAAAIVCPIVNTGIFLLGCVVFFMEAVTEWGLLSGFGGTFEYMFLGLVGGNFLFELASNIILSPVIVRVLSIEKK
ncbi:MAG: ECF transporter S component [Clostridia bacterium]|nr:ECF transporter S component [Clostridia bacterium]